MDGPTPIIIYETEDGGSRIECRFEGETIWLSQALMAELFQTTPQNVTQHLKALYEEGEIDDAATCKDFLQVRQEGDREVRRNLRHYNLPAIVAVGFRVRSARGTQFRRWANTQLRELMRKGFVMDDERLKNPDASVYFDELLERIRDIRSSEKVFWRKVCDIYATSVDYDGQSETSQRFFAEIQNKMHWAAHGHTAAELIHERADSGRPQMGLTHFSGASPRKSEVEIAKNYLAADELDLLNRIVTAYLEFAELQAKRGRTMAMADWTGKLDDFLKLGDHDLLTHAGKISAEQAKEKAHREFDRFRALADAEPSRVDRDLETALKRLPSAKKND